MLELLIAILLGLAAPAFTNTTNTDGTVVTTMDGETDPVDDSGGDTGHIPPKPPKP